MGSSLNRLYCVLGISKQGFHQRLARQLKQQSYYHQLLFLVYQVRADHPTMGARDMYYLLHPEFIGRDAFEEFCRGHGLLSERPINYARTTNSQGVVRFDNLTVNLKLTRINQLWVSDITYFEVSGRFYYLTFILDAFSRLILGHSVSKRLFTEQTTLSALEMSYSRRKGVDLNGTILHSDGGGQYYDKEFLIATQRQGLVNSMCEYPWENGKAERINGVIKNNYLRHRSINSFMDLVKEVDCSVQLYNEKKPHKALNRVSPLTFEKKYIESGKTSDGEKSTTEYQNSNQRESNSPLGCGKTSSGSNITLEYD
jgi:putative transposase